jgi:hypothetical protein
MNGSDEYLAQLFLQLKNFPAAEQAALIEEIASHLESAGAEPDESEKLQDWRENMQKEMGSVQEMGRGFRRVYQPGRFLDFVLVLIPVYLVFPLLLPLLISLIGKSPTQLSASILSLDLRLTILIGILFAVIGQMRHSRLLLAFWISDAMARLVTLMTREQRWLLGGSNGAVESIIWWVILTVLLAWLVVFVWRNRQDSLIVFFALLPFIDTALNVASQPLASLYNIQVLFPQWNWMGFTLQHIAQILCLAGFFLFLQRDLRWFCLLVGEVFTISSSILFASGLNPALVGIWSASSMLVIVLWLVDWRKRRAVSG